MNATAWSVVVALIGVVIAITSSAFISGMRWGRFEADNKAKWGILQSQQNDMSQRLARIEGMFTLTLKGHPPNDP